MRICCSNNPVSFCILRTFPLRKCPFCSLRAMGALLWVQVVCSESCHQLTGASPVKVIAGEPCSKPPVLLGD